MKTPLRVEPEPRAVSVHYIFDVDDTKLAITNEEIAKEFVHIANNFGDLVFGLEEIRSLCDQELFTPEKIVAAIKEMSGEMLAQLKAGQS